MCINILHKMLIGLYRLHSQSYSWSENTSIQFSCLSYHLAEILCFSCQIACPIWSGNPLFILPNIWPYLKRETLVNPAKKNLSYLKRESFVYPAKELVLVGCLEVEVRLALHGQLAQRDVAGDLNWNENTRPIFDNCFTDALLYLSMTIISRLYITGIKQTNLIFN